MSQWVSRNIELYTWCMNNALEPCRCVHLPKFCKWFIEISDKMQLPNIMSFLFPSFCMTMHACFLEEKYIYDFCYKYSTDSILNNLIQFKVDPWEKQLGTVPDIGSWMAEPNQFPVFCGLYKLELWSIIIFKQIKNYYMDSSLSCKKSQMRKYIKINCYSFIWC